jgi:succinate dehydrogenase/fumarate reductase cytochrome b subunit
MRLGTHVSEPVSRPDWLLILFSVCVGLYFLALVTWGLMVEQAK